MWLSLLALLTLCATGKVAENTSETPVGQEKLIIARGKLLAPSLVGCSIKKMPELYNFLMERWALYHNLEYDSGEEKKPRLIFYNDKDEVVETVSVKKMTADEISNRLDSLGFYKRSKKGEEVPEEFKNFPLKAPRDEL
ncbi:hypothetical protein MHYP_G00253540 [Metynnis hypsauchen]